MVPIVAFLVYVVFPCCVGPIVFARGFRDFHKRRLIQNTPNSRVGSMAMGLVEVEVETVQGSEHFAPFSGRRCVYWQVEIAWFRMGPLWPLFSKSHRAVSGSPFFVRDATGIAVVFPKDAECRVFNLREETLAPNELPEAYLQYMVEHGLGRPVPWGMSSLMFREWIVEVGERVFVLGTATPRPQAVGVSSDEGLTATGTDGASGRGIVELQHRAVAAIHRGDEDVFIISHESERGAALRFGSRAWVKLVGGVALTLFGLCWFLQWLTVIRQAFIWV